MNTNKSLGICASGWIKAAWLMPLLACSWSLYAQTTTVIPKPAVPAIVKPPVVKPAVTPAPAAPAAQPGRATTPATAPVRPMVPATAPVRPTAPATAPIRPSNPAGPVSTNGVSSVRGGSTRAPLRPPAPGTREVGLRGGGTAHLDNRGRVTDWQRGDTSFHRNLNGSREIRGRTANGALVYVGRGNRGYVQGRYMYGGREFAHRTYYANGVAYDRFYRQYAYRDIPLVEYAPVRYYAPAYYGYAYSPFGAPVPYPWGWAGSPYAVYYSPYFTPYPVYPGPSYWLTDYMISNTLAASYQAQVDAANGAPPPAFASAPFTPLTPAVKQQISDEVRYQIAMENTEANQIARGAEIDPASSGIARMLADNTIAHVFVVGADLDVYNTRGQACVLSPGDVIRLSAPPPPGAASANLVVLANKPQECVTGDMVSVAFADLQEMQNHMRESIDQGLGELQVDAGKNGLPALPQSARAQPTDAPFAPFAPPPDPNAAAEITQQVREADNGEREAAGQSNTQTSAVQGPVAPRQAGPTQPVKRGDTFDQVEAVYGRPTNALVLGSSTVYSYEDLSLRIVFRDGRVIDIQ
jgi:hypothetical protein